MTIENLVIRTTCVWIIYIVNKRQKLKAEISKQINSKYGLVGDFELVINKGMPKQNNYH